jgi:ATP-dependent exoDNAse (exonuclease V) beta subunit
MKYSKDGKVCFDPLKHTYFNGDKKLTGVTSFISKYKQPFDADDVAEKYAKKNNLVKEDVLKLWKEESERSKIHGSACHKVIEDYIITGDIIKQNISPKENVAEKFINDFFKTQRLIPVEVESIVYNENLASQIDCIVKNKFNQYFIIDWKSNKKITKFSFGKKMLHPFDMLPDANYYHYSLQLSIYKELCKDYNIKSCFIVHLKDNDYEIIQPEIYDLKSIIYMANYKTKDRIA